MSSNSTTSTISINNSSSSNKTRTTATNRVDYSKKAGTKLIRDTFKGNPTIGVWDVDDKGKVIGKAPIISFGYNKVKAIVDHLEEIRIWAAEQEEAKELASAEKEEKEENRVKIEDLSPADLAAIQAILNKSKK